MGAELLPPAALTPSANTRRRPKWSPAVISLACCALFVFGSQSFIYNSSTQSPKRVVPMNAQHILDECAALYTLPGTYLLLLYSL